MNRTFWTCAVTLEQLRAFVAVAEREHVTRAAEALALAQSAVSHAIAAIEARYGAELFDRIGRRIVLTDAGRALLPRARAILADVGDAERTLREFGAGARGRLAVGASQTVASYWLPRYLMAFRAGHPAVEIALKVGNSREIAEAVETGGVDLGFVEDEGIEARLVSEIVAQDQLLVLVRPEHPWAAKSPAASELSQGEWILREPGSGTRASFERALSALGVDPRALQIVLELPTNEAVRAAVEAGSGATALSASVAAASLEAGLLAAVSLPLPPRAFRLLRRKGRPESRLEAAFMAETIQASGRRK